MGQDKGLLNFKGQTLIQSIISTIIPFTDELILVIRKEQIKEYKPLLNKFGKKLRIKTDKKSDLGPLMGILVGLEFIKSERALVLPCDSPFISEEFIDLMFNYSGDNYKALVPYGDDGHMEPLHSIYYKSVIPVISNLLDKGDHRVRSLIEALETKYIPIATLDPQMNVFRNLNRPEDLQDNL